MESMLRKMNLGWKIRTEKKEKKKKKDTRDSSLNLNMFVRGL